jgi:hypothetical protein
MLAYGNGRRCKERTHLRQPRLVELLSAHSQWSILNVDPSQLEAIAKSWLVKPCGSTFCILNRSPLQLLLHTFTGPLQTRNEVVVMVDPGWSRQLTFLDV